MLTKEELEQKALEEYNAHLGKTLFVHDFIFGYKGEDSVEWQVDHREFPNGVRVRVVKTEKSSVLHWNDGEWLDPYWDVELVDHPEEMKEGRSFWVNPTCYNINGEEQKPDFEVANE